ncbi:MAG: GrpB family protein [Alphaproteobacteria bacterium]|nr:GrpB family protein [Alphaproteobacteria bacterium]
MTDRKGVPGAAPVRETGLIGGVEVRAIVVVPYRQDWPETFRLHRERIAAALGAEALGIDHIGSTAVPGLDAKPIVDILVAVADLADEETYLPAMEACGYQLRVRESDFEEHRMFRTPELDVHVHVLSDGSPEIERYLRFRDALRATPFLRARYQELKRSLAAQDRQDMNVYARAKSEFVEAIVLWSRRTDRRRPQLAPGGG